MITEQQRKARRMHLGSSDIPALFKDELGKSLDPEKTPETVYGSLAALWGEKVFEIEPEEIPVSDPRSRGNRYEAALIEFAAGELGCEIDTDPERMHFVCKAHPIFACNLDGIAVLGGVPHIIEAKMYSNPWEWGEKNTDGVPLRVNLQVQQQMLCTGFTIAYVVALLSRFGRHSEELFVVERNEKIIKAIINRGEQFWTDYVMARTPPPASEPGDIDVFKRVIRRPQSYAEGDLAPLIEQWDALRSARLQAEKDEKTAFAELLKNIGDAEGAHYDGEREFTYFQTEKNSLDTAKVKAQYPEVYAACTKVSTYRTARLSKIK